MHDIWLGSPEDLHAKTRILLHFTHFMVRSQKLYQPYGPREHIPNSIGERTKPLDEALMRKMMIPIFAKFVAKRVR